MEPPNSRPQETTDGNLATAYFPGKNACSTINHKKICGAWREPPNKQVQQKPFVEENFILITIGATSTNDKMDGIAQKHLIYDWENNVVVIEVGMYLTRALISAAIYASYLGPGKQW